MWSTSQRSAGSSHPEGCWQCRSRTSIARRNAPVKVRRRDTEITRSGPSKTIRSMSASDSSGTIWPGATTVPSASSQIRAKLVFAGEDGDQRARSETAGLGRSGSGWPSRRGRRRGVGRRCAPSRRVCRGGVVVPSTGSTRPPRSSRRADPTGPARRPSHRTWSRPSPCGLRDGVARRLRSRRRRRAASSTRPSDSSPRSATAWPARPTSPHAASNNTLRRSLLAPANTSTCSG